MSKPHGALAPSELPSIVESRVPHYWVGPDLEIDYDTVTNKDTKYFIFARWWDVYAHQCRCKQGLAKPNF
jgi:hypothetical protein